MDELKSGGIWRGLGVGISLGLFLTSLSQPAVTEQFTSLANLRHGAVEHSGFELLLLGWFYFAFSCFYLVGNMLPVFYSSGGPLKAFLGALATFGWFANPCYLMALVIYKRVSSSLEWSLIAAAIALLSAFVIHWGLAAHDVQMHEGVYYWVAAMLVLLLVQMTRTPEPLVAETEDGQHDIEDGQNPGAGQDGPEADQSDHGEVGHEQSEHEGLKNELEPQLKKELKKELEPELEHERSDDAMPDERGGQGRGTTH